jgi:AraC-like DNA-binding protein
VGKSEALPTFFLLKDLQKQSSLKELAQKTVGLNRNKLNHEFRLLFGDTVFTWLREQRLQPARLACRGCAVGNHIAHLF